MESSDQDFFDKDDSHNLSAEVDVTIGDDDLKTIPNPTTKTEYCEAIEALLEKNAILEHKMSGKEVTKEEQNKVFEKKQFHLDTMNMMTKYQIVFLKLETSLKKIMANNDWRNELRKRKGFQKFKENAMKNNIIATKSKAMTNAKTERCLKNLFRIAEKSDIREKYFMKWKLHAECEKKEQRILNNK